MKTNPYRCRRNDFNICFALESITTCLMIISQLCSGATTRKSLHSYPAFRRAQTANTSKSFSDALTNKRTNTLRTLQKEEAKDKEYVAGGSEECPCVDSNHLLATISDCVTDAGSPGFTAPGGCYPLDYGNTCGTHDLIYDPVCMAGSGQNSSSDIPSHCYDQWCYIDYNKCKLSNEYFYRSAFVEEDKHLDLYYSYSTCSSVAGGWLHYQTRSSVDQLTLKVTVPRMYYPEHFKYTEEGTIATELSYYYNDSIPWVGTLVDYLNAVVAVSNIRDIHFISRSVSSDNAYPESFYTASVHDVSAGISDFAGGQFWITSERLTMTTFSTPFATERLHLFVKQPQQTSGGTLRYHAEKILMPFTKELWIVLLCLLCVTSIVIIHLDRSEGHQGVWSDKTSGPYWRKASTPRKIGILLKTFLDSFIIHSSHLLGHAVDYDPFTTIALKIMYFGFAVVIFIAVAAYTANLAAYLTLSGTVDYVSNMEEAIATNTPVCVNPILEELCAAAWPGATFLYNRTAGTSGLESLMGMMAMYDAGECGAIGFHFESLLIHQEFMKEFCDRNLVSTVSYILEMPLAFPVRSTYAAGLSYWLYEAEKQSITYDFFQEQRIPNQVCNLKVSRVSPGVDELLSLNPASMIMPFLIWLFCMVVALFVNALRIRKKRLMQARSSQMKRLDKEEQASPSNFGSSSQGQLPRSISYLSPSHKKRSVIITTNNNQQVDNKAITDLLQQQHMEFIEIIQELTGNHQRNVASKGVQESLTSVANPAVVSEIRSNEEDQNHYGNAKSTSNGSAQLTSGTAQSEKANSQSVIRKRRWNEDNGDIGLNESSRADIG